VNPQSDGGSGVAVHPHHIPVVTVIVHKDETGYGMKVSGDKPVYVQSVKEGKSAFGTLVVVYFVKPVTYFRKLLQNGKHVLSRIHGHIMVSWALTSCSLITRRSGKN
jgi:hypothetical protein